MAQHIPSKSLISLKRSAKQLSKSSKMTLADALNKVAKNEGFATWALLACRYDQCKINSMDALWQSLLSNQLVLLAARPGVGKVSLAVNMAIMAAKKSYPVIYLSSISSSCDIHKKLLAIHSSLPRRLLLLPQDELSCNDVALITKGQQDIDQLPIQIIQEQRLSIASILKHLDKANVPPKFMIVDYLQNIESNNIEDTIYQCRSLSKKYQCTIILISQLIDPIERKKIIHPSLNDLPGGKQLARHCDTVVGLYREGVYHAKKDKRISEVYILKSRMASYKKIQLSFNPETGIFSW